MDPLHTLKRPRIDEDFFTSSDQEKEESLTALEKIAEEIFRLCPQVVKPAAPASKDCPHAYLKKRIALLKSDIDNMKGELKKQSDQPPLAPLTMQPAGIKSKESSRKIPAEKEMDRILLKMAAQSTCGINQTFECFRELSAQWADLKLHVSQAHREFYEELSSACFATISTDYLPLREEECRLPQKVPFRIAKPAKSYNQNREIYPFDPFLTACISYYSKNPSFSLILDFLIPYCRAGFSQVLLTADVFFHAKPFMFFLDLKLLRTKAHLAFTPCAKPIQVNLSADCWMISSKDFSSFGREVQCMMQYHALNLIKTTLCQLTRPLNQEMIEKNSCALKDFMDLAENIGIVEHLSEDLKPFIEISKHIHQPHPLVDIACDFQPLKRMCQVLAFSKTLRENPPFALIRKAVESSISRSQIPAPLLEAMTRNGQEGFQQACKQLRIEAVLKTDKPVMLIAEFDHFLKFLADNNI